MTKNNGGPAFPQKRIYRDSQGIDHEVHDTGMTLRDWFAGQWVAAGHHANLTCADAAGQAYGFADAMIAARGSE